MADTALERNGRRDADPEIPRAHLYFDRGDGAE